MCVRLCVCICVCYFRLFPNRFHILFSSVLFSAVLYCTSLVLAVQKRVLSMHIHIHTHVLLWTTCSLNGSKYCAVCSAHIELSISRNRYNDHDDGVTLDAALLCTWSIGFWYAWISSFRTNIMDISSMPLFCFSFCFCRFFFIFFVFLVLVLVRFFLSFTLSCVCLFARIVVMLIKSQEIL